MRQFSYIVRLIEGATERAEHLGYTTEELALAVTSASASFPGQDSNNVK